MSDTVFHSEGVLIDHVPVSALKAGEIVFVQSIAGQAVTDIDAGQLGALRTEGVIRCATVDTFVAGDVVNYDTTLKQATLAASTGVLGKAIADSAVASVLVKLNA